MICNQDSKRIPTPGVEPGSTAWKAAMLTTIPLTLVMKRAPCIFLQQNVTNTNTITPHYYIRQKCHCRDQDSNLGYCGHNAGS